MTVCFVRMISLLGNMPRFFSVPEEPVPVAADADFLCRGTYAGSGCICISVTPSLALT